MTTAEQLWSFIAANECAPYTPEAARQWSSASFGAFLHDVESFDAKFFGVSPAQARLMDPQQRMLLSVGYEALVCAGYTKPTLKGLNCGVFTGMLGNTEFPRVSQDVRDSKGPYAVTGSLPSCGNWRARCRAGDSPRPANISP